MPEFIYLDNHSAARPFPAAVDKMLPYFKEYWGSPLSPHYKGQEALPLLAQAHASILETLGAAPEDKLAFFNSHKETLFRLYNSVYTDIAKKTGKSQILTTAIEEHLHSQLKSFDLHPKYIPLNANGQVVKEALAQAIGPRTALVSLSWANALTGVIHPIDELAALCKEKGVSLHVDAGLALGKHYFRFKDVAADFMTFDGSKFHAPLGSSLLLAKKYSPFFPDDGKEVQGASFIGFCTAMQQIYAEFEHLCTETARLRDKLEQGLKDALPDASVLFEKADRLSCTSAVTIPGVAGEALLFALNRKGLYATTGNGKLSQLLINCGLPREIAHSSISFTLSYETTEKEIDRAIEIIAAAAKKLRLLSGAIL